MHKGLIMKDFVKGETVDEKFKSINQTLKHFSGRLSRKVVGVLPTSPVFEFVFTPEADGTVLRRLFPGRGKITKSCIYIAQHGEGKKSTFLVAAIKRREQTFAREFEIKKAPLVFDLDQPIEAGDLLTITVDGPLVRGIWIGFLYEVGIEALAKQEFMLDQIEVMIRENQDAGACQEG